MTKAKISSSFGALLAAAVIFSPNFAKSSDLLDGLNDPAPAETRAQVNWNQMYLQGFGGFAWTEWNGPLGYDDRGIDDGFDDSDRSIKSESWFVGVGAGGDRQFGKIVLGGVVDVATGDISESGSFLPYPESDGAPAWDITTELEYFGTVRGRLGYLVRDDFLVYGTGGLAWGLAKSSIQPVYNKGEEGEYVNGNASDESAHIGWTAGAGFEWKLSNNVSFTTEYLYLNLGDGDYSFSGTKGYGNGIYATDSYDPELDVHAIKAGLNYRF
ncbi:MAG TPA: outer membrane beta-barrel protein [Candidatus Binatia bacterium]|nr:outer membrane beta-barrel protein [Candidatus Binatia bacterium]